jgi:DNA-binding CsgD family transcriptional regulator
LGAAEASAAAAQVADATLAEAAEYALRGLGSRQRPERGWVSLTQSEQRVAHLAAEGLSNAQIAERLFISVHTVKVHLARAYTKLEVSGRAQLAAIATAHPPQLDRHGNDLVCLRRVR